MFKKMKKTQIARHSVQLIMFFLLPGLYTMTFSELKTVYEMIIKGNFNFIQAFPSLVEFVAVMLFTIVMGRWFCGWMCAFGTYNDWIYLLSKKVFKTKFKVNEKVDDALKYIKYVVLLFILIVVCTMGSNILEGTSPWDAFAQITDFSNVISTLLVGFIVFLLITIGAFFIERFFCRYLCPLGAVFSIVSRLGIVKINKPSDNCGKCRACTYNCSMGLNLYKVQQVKGGDCINCLKCVDICPRSNANINILGQDLDAKLTTSIAMATFVGAYALTNAGGTAINNTNLLSNGTSISSSAASDNASQNYKDGTYTGSGEGFKGGTTKVSVTIAGGKITNIETLSNEDTPKYYERVEGTIPKSIISKQSTSVDTVSGATYSSKGIISAVQNALNQAANSSSASQTDNSNSSNETNTASTPKNEKSSTSNSKVNEAITTSDSTNSNQGTYKDGTYTGSGRGFKGGTTKVSVTVANGKITNIETLSNGDTPKYYERVEGTITKSIISKQSTSVDTVSGATYSSKGIMSAVQDALSQAQ